MDVIEPSDLQPLGGVLMLVVVFVLRELVSGALKQAGKDIWEWAKVRCPSRRPPTGARSGRPHLKVIRIKRDRAVRSKDEAA